MIIIIDEAKEKLIQTEHIFSEKRKKTMKEEFRKQKNYFVRSMLQNRTGSICHESKDLHVWFAKVWRRKDYHNIKFSVFVS